MVKYLLEQLPRADSVPGIYEATYFPRSSACLTVARNPKGSCRSQGYSGKRNPSDMFSFLNSKHRSGLTLDHSCRPSLEADLPLTMRFRRMVETCRSSLQGNKNTFLKCVVDYFEKTHYIYKHYYRYFTSEIYIKK